MENNVENKSNKGIIIALSIVIVVLIGTIAFMFMNNNSTKNLNDNKTEENEQEEEQEKENEQDAEKESEDNEKQEENDIAKEEYIPEYFENIKSIKFTTYNYVDGTLFETVNRTMTELSDIKEVLTVIDKKEKPKTEGGLGGTNIPYLELIYGNKTIRIELFGYNVIGVDGEIFEVVYDDDIQKVIENIFNNSEVVNETTNHLEYFEGIKSITYHNGDPKSKEINITDINKIKRILVVFNFKDGPKTEGGLGGVNCPTIKLIYENKTIEITYYGYNVITVGKEIYEVKHDGDIIEAIEKIING